MARIPTRREGQRLSQASPVQGESPGAARREGENIARAGAALGNLSGALGNYFEKKNKVDNKLFEHEVRVRAEQVYQEAMFKARQDKRLEDDGSNMLALYKEHSSGFNEQIEGMDDGLNKRVARRISLDVSNGFTKKVYSNMIGFDAAHKAKRVEDFRDSMTTTMMANPEASSIDEARNRFTDYVDALGLDPETRAKVESEFNESADLAIAQGHALKGNYQSATEHVMNSDNFSPKQKTSLVKDIINQQQQVANINYTRDQRERTQQKQALQDQREDFSSAVMNKLIEAGDDLQTIAEVEAEVQSVFQANPTLATKEIRNIVKSFKDPERKQVQDEVFYDFQERIYKGRDMKSLMADINAAIGNRELDPRDAVTLLNRLRANSKKSTSDKSFAIDKKAAESLLNATVTPDGFDITGAFYKGKNLARVAGVRELYAVNIDKGMRPTKAMRKALIASGLTPKVIIPHIPLDAQDDAQKVELIKRKIVDDIKGGKLKSRDDKNRARDILKAIPEFIRRENEKKSLEELIRLDKVEEGK